MRSFHRVVRMLAYILELLVLFTIQETPGLTPSIFGARPVLLWPAVLTIAMFEKEVTALVFGVAGGLLCDFGFSGVLGFHGLVLGILCFCVSLMVQVYLQINLVTAVLAALVTVGITLVLQWFFLYSFTYSEPKYVFTHHHLPKYFYTMIFVPLLYFLNRGICQTISPQES